jgi:hypothetical protein
MAKRRQARAPRQTKAAVNPVLFPHGLRRLAELFVAALRRNNPPKKLTRRSEIGALRLAAATRKNAFPLISITLISAGGGRDREPELFRGLEVDREISRFLNFRGAASRTVGESDGCTTLRREYHDDCHAVLESPRDHSPSSPPRGA